MKIIAAKEFKEIFKKGIENVVKDRQQLNDINVFPVADGDTGDNLSLTLLPLYELIDALPAERVDHLTAALSSRMLQSARGNSGVIFSQFFSSFAKAIEGHEALLPRQFAAALKRATSETYDSLAQPKEGTILTVIRHTAEEFMKSAAEEDHFPSIFSRARQKSREILEKTRHMLPQLKKARVIDAGGLGFYLFFEGMASYFKEKKDRFLEFAEKYLHPHKMSLPATEARYCCQWVIAPRQQGRDFFKQLLTPLGKSLIVAGDHRLCNIHIHTDQPQPIEDALNAHAVIQSRKVEDLESQQTQFQRQMPALVIDSAIDIPATVERENRIGVVAMTVTVNGRPFQERIDLSKEDLYRRMLQDKTAVLKTSQPAPADFKAAYSDACKRGSRVLVFTLSAKLSGTHQSARQGALLLSAHDQGRISLFDTTHVSAGSGLLVLKALEMLHAGKTMEETLAHLGRLREKVVSLAYLDNLEYVARSGRAPRGVAWLAHHTRLKPLVHFDEGLIKRAGLLFNPRDHVRQTVRKFLKKLDRQATYSIGIAYTDNPDTAERVEQALEKSGLKIKFCYKIQAAAALGVHAGPGTYCLWALPEEN